MVDGGELGMHGTRRTASSAASRTAPTTSTSRRAAARPSPGRYATRPPRRQRPWWHARGSRPERAADRRTLTGRGALPVAATVAVNVSVARFADADAVDADADDRRVAEHAVLTRDDAFPDALAGAPLTAGGPLLTTRPDAMPAVTLTELERALRPGAVVYSSAGSTRSPPATRVP